MKKQISWIFSDLLLHKRFTFLFVLNLALGMTGLITLDSFKTQLQSSLNMKSRLVLGADLGVSSRQPFSAKQKSVINEVLGEVPASKVIETYSMVANAKEEARLVQLKAIDSQFPFYGAIHLEKAGAQSPKNKYLIHQGNKVWVYPEVLQQLGVAIGENLKIGTKTFEIVDIVNDDSAAGFSTSMAPRVYMSLSSLSSTGLITQQSMAWFSTLYKKQLNDEDLQKTVEKIFKLPELDAGVQVYSHKNVSEQLNRMLGYLNDYLGLVSIAAIFLSCIGAIFLFRSYLNTKVKEIAIFRSLGMTFVQSLSIYVWQILILGLAASGLTYLVAMGLTPLLGQLLDNFISIPTEMVIRWQSIVVVLLLGILGSVLICLPLLISLKDLKPSALFQSTQIRLKETPLAYALHGVGVIVLWLLAVWQSSSWIVGSLFMGVFIACGAILGLLAVTTLWLFNRFGKYLPLVPRIAIRNLSGQPKTTISCFLALGMGILLLNIIPQIEASLQLEIEHPEKSKLPSFFLFDIQDNQVDLFKQLVESSGNRLGQISPMIRGRLIQVNGQAFEKDSASKEAFSREEQSEARFRNRGFNLSYRSQLDSSEAIVKGRPFSGRFNSEANDLAEVSIEKRFAGRLNLAVGDELDFEIQGVPILTKIVNLRTVRWTSFQPNFFVQFQPGVLEEAPKTYVASIEDMSKSKKSDLQSAIVKKFPNISIIDVTRIVKRLIDVSQQMSIALQFMALLCLLVGLLVMYSIASHQATQRRRDINLIKVLGAPYSTIRNLFVLEFSILAAFAGFMGVILSMTVSYMISYVLFEGTWSWSPVYPVLSFLLLIALVSLLSYLSVGKVLKEKASFYL